MLLIRTGEMQAFVLAREFILGKNTTGLVGSNGKIVQGASNVSLQQDALPEYDAPIFFGAGSTTGSTVWPSATIAAWESFIVTGSVGTLTSVPTATGASGSGGGGGSNAKNGAESGRGRTLDCVLVIIVVGGLLF